MKKVFVVYGMHANEDAEKAINKINEVVLENKLNYGDLISIIEIGVKFEREQLPSMRSLREEINIMRENHEKGLELLKENTPHNMSETDMPFHQRLAIFLYGKGVQLEFETLNEDIYFRYIQKWITKQTELMKYSYESSMGIDPNSPHPLQQEHDLRDKELIEQMAKISKSSPNKTFLIVRGVHHVNLSKFLISQGYVVKDYSY